MKRKQGRLRKGEVRPPKAKTRLERQDAGDMTLGQMLDPKFSSWSLIPANPGRCFHAISARYRPIVQLKRITKWVSYF